MTEFKSAVKASNEKFAELLFSFRTEAKLSRQAMRDRIGCNSSLIPKTEKEGRRVNLGELLLLCAGLGINPVALLQHMEKKHVSYKLVRLEIKFEHEGITQTHQNHDFDETVNLVKTLTSKYLKEQRETTKLTLADLSDKTGQVRSYFYKSEHNLRNVDLGEFKQICLALGLKPATALREIVAKVNATSPTQQCETKS